MVECVDGFNLLFIKLLLLVLLMFCKSIYSEAYFYHVLVDNASAVLTLYAIKE